MPGQKIVERHFPARLKRIAAKGKLTRRSSSVPNHVQNLASEQISQDRKDFIDAAVPAGRRYSTLTMTLLWITMLTNFPMVIIGFEFYRMGFSLRQVFVGTITGSMLLLASVTLGTLLFPITGWLLGHISGASDTAAFTRFMNDYSFGSPWLAVLVLAIGYFALNDGNLYGAINAFENIWKIERHKAVVLLVLLAILLATGLTICPNALDTLATLNCVVLPCVTMVIICEFFVVRPLLLQMPMLQIFSQIDKCRFSMNQSSQAVCTAAGTAVIASWAVGIAMSGIIPQLRYLNSGVWILYPWLSAFVIYAIFRALQIYGAMRRQTTIMFVEDSRS